MALSRLLASATISAVFSSSVAAQASDTCWSADERHAVQLKTLHSFLMVGTMHCRTRYAFSVPAYNAFVTSQRAALDNNSLLLRAHFTREQGPAGETAYDRYATRLANSQSENFRDFRTCSDVADLAYEASDANAAELLRLAYAFAPPPEEDACLGQPMAIAAVQQAAPRAAAAPGAAPVAISLPPARIVIANAPAAPVIEASAPAAPAAEVAFAAASIIAAAADMREASEPADSGVQLASRDEALQAAIAALQAATIALQAAAGGGSEGDQIEAIPIPASAARIDKTGAPLVMARGAK